uniref:J domain-containing protein n=1 Tax=Glycine max TaxID=3847 RepID=A0A0R0GQY1_SOYBN
MISFMSFSASFPAISFSGNAMAFSLCRIKFRLIVAFTTAIATAEACSSWMEQPRPSYLNSSCSSIYDILGIPVGASNQEIKAVVCHLDVVAIDKKNSSADEFIKIHAAYSTLSDPDKRTNYDRSLFWRQQSLKGRRQA